MKRIVLGDTGLEAYQLGFGGIPIQRVDEAHAVDTVVHALERGLDFETGMIMVPGKEKGRLLCVAGYGLTQTQENRLKESGLSLHETGHPLVRSFNQREPVLEQRQEKETENVSDSDGPGTQIRHPRGGQSLTSSYTHPKRRKPS